jgi:hypothetical protein
MFLNYKTKQMVARNPEGKEVAYITIIDDHAKLTESPDDFEKYQSTRKQRYWTKAEYEHERINKILMGEIVKPLEGECPQ